MQEVCCLGRDLRIGRLVELLLQVGLVLKHLDEICKETPRSHQYPLVDFLACRSLTEEEILLHLVHLLVAVRFRLRHKFDQIIKQRVSNAEQIVRNKEVSNPLLNRFVDACGVSFAN